ncbi:hypothetical protein WL40_08250 [Burkholderia ubonensis]|nr:hypothetical protein WL40_08250 [Burkholderia ubonensis]
MTAAGDIFPKTAAIHAPGGAPRIGNTFRDRVLPSDRLQALDAHAGHLEQPYGPVLHAFPEDGTID